MKHSILIVEDDYAILRGLKDSFISKNYDVTSAMDGEQAMQQLQRGHYDIILLDIMLPKYNGFEICSYIRDAAIDTPVIMLTAMGEERDVVRGLNLGADDYIAKPFSVIQLHAKCDAFLRRYKREDTILYRFGQYEFNEHERTVINTYNDAALNLTPKEFSLLHLFLRREGRALTRQAILTAVWGASIITTERSVDRCVTTLRKKIESNPKQPKFIQVVRDVGYRFTAVP